MSDQPLFGEPAQPAPLTENDRKRQWLDDYVSRLPPNIRPREDDSRFLAACAAAYSSGWTAVQIAGQVCGMSYANAMNPPLMAIMHMERLSARPPHVVAMRPAHASGCLVCAPGQTCDDPVKERTPIEWARERVELMRVLLVTRGLTEDQRAGVMVDLIGRQRSGAA